MEPFNLPPPPFLTKTYDMIDDPLTNVIVSWSPICNNSFVVWDFYEFSRALLPRFFKHNNFSSFVRQLNTYGFRKVDPDRWEFAHEEFIRGQRHRLKNIHRKRTRVSTDMHLHARAHAGASSLQIYGGAHQMTRPAESELEQLRKERNVMMIELGRLGGQHQFAHQQMKSISDRLQAMEVRQQQMVAFVARTMCAPSFLFQYVNQAIEADHRQRQQKPLDDHMEDSPSRDSWKRRCLMHPNHCTAERDATAGTNHDRPQWQMQQQHFEDDASSCEINPETTATSITTSDDETAASYDHKLLVQLNLENDTNSAMHLDNFMQGGGVHPNDNMAYQNQQMHARTDHHEETRSSGEIPGDTKKKMKKRINEGFSRSNQHETHEHLGVMDLNVQPMSTSEEDFTYVLIQKEPSVAQGDSPAKYNDTHNEDLESELFWEHLLGPVSMQADHNASRNTFVGCYSMNE